MQSEVNYQVKISQSLQKSPKLRDRKINQLRQSFKLSIQPNRVTQIKTYLSSPRYIPGETTTQQIRAELGEQNEDDGSYKFEQKYELEKKIGQGANGYVMICKSKTSGKRYAAKHIILDDEQAFFLKKNFRAIRCLNHEYVVHYKSLHIQRKKHQCYLIMQFIHGKNLKQIKIKDQKIIKVIFYQLLQALDYIHKMGVCHRDIKPDNIIYNQQTGKIKVVDFGIGRKIIKNKEKVEMLTSIGTLQYKPPQMFQGGFYNENVDIWSAGVTLFQMVTGVTPFQSQYKLDTINNILNYKFAFTDEWKQYHPLLKDLVMRLLKPSKERLSAIHALQHPWFQMQCDKQMLLKFSKSQKQKKQNSQNFGFHVSSIQKPTSKSTKTNIKPQIISVQSEQQGVVNDK